MPPTPARLLTLGRFELIVETSVGPRSVPSQARRLALLAYLSAQSPPGFRRRDTLLGLLWPELGQDEARRALRQALHYLRQLLGDNAIVTRADDQIGIGDGLNCDVTAFEQAIGEKRWADALALYRGPFLDGVFVPNVAPEFEEWFERTRARLKSAATAAAWQLAAAAESAGDESTAARAALRAHELAPDDEAGLRRLLELLQRQGDRAGALRAYDNFTRRMAEKYGLQPAAESVALGESIRRASPTTRASNVAAAPERQSATVHAQVAARPAARAGPSTATRVRRPRVLALLGAVVILAVVAIAYTVATIRSAASDPAAPGLLQTRDRVLVSDFTNQTADSTLGAVLAEALRVDIAQSPHVRVLTTAQMRGALRLMERPVEVTVDDSLARAIAIREGVKAFVSGEVEALGTSFLVSLRLVAAPSGDLLAAVRETARDSTDLVAAIDRLSATLRARMGEALQQLEAEPALEKVTTASLPALRLFSQSVYVTDVQGDRPAAIKLLEKAVALDSSFAMAHRRLGALYSAVAEPGRAAESLERAFAFRERLPLRERYLTMGSYYRVVTREYEKAAAAYRALLELYPQDLAGLNNIALVYFADRQFARADSFFSQVIALDSTIPSVYLARAEALISQSRFDSARHVLDRVWERFPEYPQTRLTEAYLAAARQDWPSAERHLQLRLAASRDREFDQINARQMLGQIALLGGRLAEAEQHLSTALALAQSNELSGRYLTQTILLAWLDLLYRRQPARALARVDSALQKFPLAGLDPGDRPYIELADLYTAADQPARARALLAAAERDSAAAATLRGAGWHELRGVVALAEGRARAAVSELRQADAVHSCTICVLPNLANAYRLAGDTQSAIATYERYLATPWIWRFETDAPHMAFSLQQLAQLYQQQRQPARAAEQYMRLLRLWSAADPELSGVVGAVRASLARAGGATETR